MQTSLIHDVPIDLPEVPDPIIGRLIQAHRSGAMEALVSEGFAVGRGLKPGDRVRALVNGKREPLLIGGIATAPEYIFAGLAGSPDQRGFGILWVDHATLAAAYNEEGTFNRVAVRLAPQASEGAVIDGLNRLLGPYGGVNAHGRDRQMFHMILDSEIKEQRVLGTVLPSIFLAVAGFLLNVVLSRQIATQREQIAALKALGYDNWAIGIHYLKFVMIIVAVGVLIGLLVGSWLGHGFSGIYADHFRFPKIYYRVKPVLVLAAVSVALVAAVAATLNAITSTVRLAPAEAMRPPSPGVYHPMLLERLGLKHRFSPALRMILRVMERRMVRTVLTTVGVSASIAIVVAGAFWGDSIDYLVNTQFELVLRGDVEMGLIEATPAAVLHEVRRLPGVTAADGLRAVSVRFVHEHHDRWGTIQGLEAHPDLLRIVDVDHHVSQPPLDGLLITDRLAQRLQVNPGDMLQVELQEGKRSVLQIPVRGVVKEMMGMNAYMERRALNRLLQEDDIVNQITVAVERSREPAFLLVRPAGRTHLEVKVLYSPDKGKS